MYIINVYLPYECTDNHDMYMDYLSKIAVFTVWAILMLIYPKDHLLEAFYVTSAMTIRSL